jgi:hypothetical protein
MKYKVLYRPITKYHSVVDIGDSWAMIENDGEIGSAIMKKENPLWLLAYVAKWMDPSNEVTEFGQRYMDLFYKDYFDKIRKRDQHNETQIEKGKKAAALGEIREFGGKKYRKTAKGWRLAPKGEDKEAVPEKKEGIFETEWGPFGSEVIYKEIKRELSTVDKLMNEV